MALSGMLAKRSSSWSSAFHILPPPRMAVGIESSRMMSLGTRTFVAQRTESTCAVAPRVGSVVRQEHDAGLARLLDAHGALVGVGVAVRLGVRRPLSQGVRVLVCVLLHRHRGFVMPRTESTGATAPRAG